MSDSRSRQSTLNTLLARVTPDSIAALVGRLAARQRPGNDSGVSMSEIVDTLIGDADLGKGPERWSAYLRIKRAVIEAVGQLPDMQYVEGDA